MNDNEKRLLEAWEDYTYEISSRVGEIAGLCLCFSKVLQEELQGSPTFKAQCDELRKVGKTLDFEQVKEAHSAKALQYGGDK